MSRTKQDTLTRLLHWPASAVRALIMNGKPGSYMDPSEEGFGIGIDKTDATWVSRFRVGTDNPIKPATDPSDLFRTPAQRALILG